METRMGSKVAGRSLAAVMIWLLGAAVPLQAAPVWGERFDLKQPDGSTVPVRIWGDEFYQVVESLDGYTLLRDPKTGEICYAALSSDGKELVSTGVRAGGQAPEALTVDRHVRIDPQSVRVKVDKARARFAQGEQAWSIESGITAAAQGAPIVGDVQGLCLIVDFPDEAGTIPPAEVNSFCNQVGYEGYGNHGSIRDYFYEVSDGHLTYTNFVPSAYYTAINSKGYYDNPNESAGPKARELIIEALTDLENSGFDFSQYDANGDGLIDGVNCYYAGNVGSGWSKGLWPHSWTVSFSADGVSTYRYQITDMGSSLRIGTFCHENGHMIGYWPDLYDYDYDSTGVGRFCLMAYGGSGTDPVEPCAYMKYIAGWGDVTLLTTPQSGLSATAGVNEIFKYEHPILANEYYLIENRQRIDRDIRIPDSGLAIWHIDTYGSNNNNEMTPSSHYKVTLVQADGEWDLEHDRNSGDSTDLWAAPTYTDCHPYTDPNTNWWDGGASGLGVRQISAAAGTMTFTFGIAELSVDPDELVQTAAQGEGADGTNSFTIEPVTLGAGSIAYTVEDDVDWLGVSPTAGTTTGETDVIDIVYDDAEIMLLSKGVYTATIVVSSNDVINDPLIVEVVLEVETVAPDFDGDWDVDQEDFGHLQSCYTGSGATIAEPTCEDANFDGDSDVDAADFGVFNECRTGANVTADRACDD